MDLCIGLLRGLIVFTASIGKLHQCRHFFILELYPTLASCYHNNKLKPLSLLAGIDYRRFPLTNTIFYDRARLTQQRDYDRICKFILSKISKHEGLSNIYEAHYGRPNHLGTQVSCGATFSLPLFRLRTPTSSKVRRGCLDRAM